VLLAAVSHDLRTPLAAAQAAVSCLRSGDIQLSAEDHDELLATADESLNQLAHLIASLLDVSRLQATFFAKQVENFRRIPWTIADVISHPTGKAGCW